MDHGEYSSRRKGNIELSRLSGDARSAKITTLEGIQGQINDIESTFKDNDELKDSTNALSVGNVEMFVRSEPSELGKEFGERYDEWKSRMYLDPAPSGESILDVARRVESVLPALIDTPGHVLGVGHQGVNMALKAQLSNCFSVDCLSTFRQRNDEIDLWEIMPPRSVVRINARD